MNKLIGISGDVAAAVGTLVCVLSGVARLFGFYSIAGLGTIVLFTVGSGIMIYACLAKLHLFSMRTRGS